MLSGREKTRCSDYAYRNESGPPHEAGATSAQPPKEHLSGRTPGIDTPSRDTAENRRRLRVRVRLGHQQITGLRKTPGFVAVAKSVDARCVGKIGAGCEISIAGLKSKKFGGSRK
jgi:hypothetical protein